MHIVYSRIISKKYHIVCICGLLIYSLFGNSQIMHNAVFSSQVKTIQLYPEANPLDPAVISLHGMQTLTLEFDILTQSIPNLQYRILLCDKQWNKSSLMQSEYLQTIGLLDFESIEHSINTSVPYIHFTAHFPNSNVRFLLSGNYIIQVFDEMTEEILFQQRCMIIEQIIPIQVTERRPKQVDIMDTHQAIDVEVSWEQFPISNPIQDIQIAVLQNNRWDNMRWYTKPTHFKMQSMSYTTEPQNCFFGNAEFKQFNFKNMRFAGEYIQRIDWDKGLYKVVLEPNEIQTYKPYVFRGDLNGKYLISHDVSPNNAASVADYAYVNFILAYMKQSYDTLDVYVVGGFNNWNITEENKMKYNENLEKFETAILLKQGYYDYAIAFVSKDKKHIFTHEIEGSYYQTKNMYEAIVYYYDISKGYDRIIAYYTTPTNK